MKNRGFHILFVMLYMVGLGLSALGDVSGRVRVLPGLTHTGTADLTTPTETLASIFDWSAATGTNTSQMNILYMSQRTLTNNQNETLDLYGSLLDSFGATVNLARVKLMAITSTGSSSNDLKIGGSGAGAFTNWCEATNDFVLLRPGGAFVMIATGAVAYPVTDSTGDKLRFENTGLGDVVYNVYLGGS